MNGTCARVEEDGGTMPTSMSMTVIHAVIVQLGQTYLIHVLDDKVAELAGISQRSHELYVYG